MTKLTKYLQDVINLGCVVTFSSGSVIIDCPVGYLFYSDVVNLEAELAKDNWVVQKQVISVTNPTPPVAVTSSSNDIWRNRPNVALVDFTRILVNTSEDVLRGSGLSDKLRDQLLGLKQAATVDPSGK